MEPQVETGFAPGTAIPTVTKLELAISCRNLHDADVFSLSDPMVVLEERNPETQDWDELGRTEIIWDNLNPDFETKFQIDYHFEVHQHLRFSVYDIDCESDDLEKHDFLGTVQCSLGEIAAEHGRFERQLLKKNGNKFKGTIIIMSEEILSSRDHFSMEMTIFGLPGSCLFFSDHKHFIEIRRADETGEFGLIKRTDRAKGETIVNQIDISGSKLNNGDDQRALQIQLYRYKRSGRHKLKGSFETNGAELRVRGGKQWYFNERAKLELTRSSVITKYTFMDYIQGGMQMNFVVAIDFTGSNGNPEYPNSLHYTGGYKPNQYVQAIQSVGEIIQDYDTDKLFPVYGFGARIPPEGKVSHMFPCNFNTENPFVYKVPGILEAYKQAISSVQLEGPTNFAPVIRETAQMAKLSGRSGSEFFVLLIITDGIITDMEATKRAIVDNSNLPFSIIIVGVGDANFDAMVELDSDDELLESYGRKAARDIVQFVPFRDFKSSNAARMKAQLAKEVLEEVPDQVTSYMFDNKIVPTMRQNIEPPSYTPA